MLLWAATSVAATLFMVPSLARASHPVRVLAAFGLLIVIWNALMLSLLAATNCGQQIQVRFARARLVPRLVPTQHRHSSTLKHVRSKRAPAPSSAPARGASQHQSCTCRGRRARRSPAASGSIANFAETRSLS